MIQTVDFWRDMMRAAKRSSHKNPEAVHDCGTQKKHGVEIFQALIARRFLAAIMSAKSTVNQISSECEQAQKSLTDQ